MAEKEGNIMDEWVTTAEAAKILGVTTRRVYQLIEEGEVQAKRLGRRVWLVNRETVYEYDRKRD